MGRGREQRNAIAGRLSIWLVCRPDNRARDGACTRARRARGWQWQWQLYAAGHRPPAGMQMEPEDVTNTMYVEGFGVNR